MLVQTGEISTRECFEIKIADGSKRAEELEFGRSQSGKCFRKAKKYIRLSNFIGRAKPSVMYRKSVVLRPFNIDSSAHFSKVQKILLLKISRFSLT